VCESDHARESFAFVASGKAQAHIIEQEETVESQQQLLKGVPFLAELAPAELSSLAGSLKRRRYRPNEVIFHRHDPGDALFIVLSGSVRIALRNEDGREITLTLLNAGDYFGELAVLDGEPRSADAIAVESVETLVLPRQVFLQFLDDNPRITRNLLAAMSRQYVRRLTNTVHDAAFLDVSARLARVLLNLHESNAGEPPDGARLKTTQVELAAMVGATRESINKWLGYFERQGWIERERGAILILDTHALSTRAGEP
jgi:CRP-like cAMP-binding protein